IAATAAPAPAASSWRRFADGIADELAKFFLRACDVVMCVPAIRDAASQGFESYGREYPPYFRLLNCC
ncbi:hypothetical protein, partial [Paraburkholderia kirstenboschensis]|uniref:hypothetical protein n=1 Tax=Paraburkholderia kirstenboschensis TaxID=1245436 RepID=UPI001FB53772